jgi:hypothetical protein
MLFMQSDSLIKAQRTVVMFAADYRNLSVAFVRILVLSSQVGVLCPERSKFAESGENVSGLAGEAVMLCMEPLCVRMMQLASFTLSFT